MPEAQQKALTATLTARVSAVRRRWQGPRPRLVYVTDKGQAQDDYYRRVLRRLPDPRQPGRRLSCEWALDFFPVCGYGGKLRDALFGPGGWRWFQRMRQGLRDRPQGVSNILRWALQPWQRRTMSKTAQAELWKAYRYLRRHRRWMDYARYRRQGLPSGSGVTGAACKTMFTQRLKRWGMRWGKEFGQVIVDLRVLHLSGVWDAVVGRDLQSRALPERVSSQPQATRTRRKAA